MMNKNEDRDTRYYIDVDMKSRKIIRWDYDQRDKLKLEKMDNPCYHRIYLSRGQYYKFARKIE